MRRGMADVHARLALVLAASRFAPSPWLARLPPSSPRPLPPTAPASFALGRKCDTTNAALAHRACQGDMGTRRQCDGLGRGGQPTWQVGSGDNHVNEVICDGTNSCVGQWLHLHHDRHLLNVCVVVVCHGYTPRTGLAFSDSAGPPLPDPRLIVVVRLCHAQLGILVCSSTECLRPSRCARKGCTGSDKDKPEGGRRRSDCMGRWRRRVKAAHTLLPPHDLGKQILALPFFFGRLPSQAGHITRAYRQRARDIRWQARAFGARRAVARSGGQLSCDVEVKKR